MARRPTTVARPWQWLQEAEIPAFVLTARRQVALFNRGCERLMGWSNAEILTETADWASADDPQSLEALMANLAAPAEVWNGTVIARPVDVVNRQQHPEQRLLLHVPLKNLEGQVEGVLGLFLPLESQSLARTETPWQRVHAEVTAVRQALRQRYGERTLLAKAPSMQRVLEQLRAAQTNSVPVWIVGEAGAGKTHVARQIHLGSALSRRAFVPFCGRKSPPFEVKRTLRQWTEDPPTEDPRQPGTLYLANVDQFPADVHDRLLEFLAGRGGRSVRLIVSSDVAPEGLLAAEKVSQEFWQRLDVIRLTLPALRDRLDDLPILAQSLLEDGNRQAERQITGFADEVSRAFLRYRWPGNVEELARTIQQAREASQGPLITLEDLPWSFRRGEQAQTVGPAAKLALVPLDEFLEQAERQQIEAALAATKGQIAKAAELLKVPRQRLYRRLQQWGLTEPSADQSPGDPS